MVSPVRAAEERRAMALPPSAVDKPNDNPKQRTNHEKKNIDIRLHAGSAAGSRGL